MNNDFASKDIPKCPSVLILTDPQVDLKGRFDEGKHLGWVQRRSEYQDIVVQEKAKQEKVKGGLKVKQLGQLGGNEEDEGGIEQPKQRAVIAVPLSSDRALAQLREQSVSMVTPISEIQKIASDYSQRFGVPIVISTDMGSNRYADVASCRESGRVKIHLHPIMQYRDKAYIESMIMREVEDCRDFERKQAFGWQRG